jgi:hypothetical protein
VGAERRVFATRTNKAATRAGAIVSTKPPPGTSTIWRLAGEGSAGPLDVLLHVTAGGSIATWHTQVLPRLLLTAKATLKLKKGRYGAAASKSGYKGTAARVCVK